MIDEVGRDRATGAVRVEVNPRYFRPAEVDALLADPTRVKTELGWEPKVSFAELVQMMVRHDLRRGLACLRVAAGHEPRHGGFDEDRRVCSEYF